MCDYSLEAIQNRAAKIDDMLVVTNFGTGTTGFSASENARMAVCLRPGTELAFAKAKIEFPPTSLFFGPCVAIFRKINGNKNGHHDALEFFTGEIILLTRLLPGTQARVLQLPADEVPEEKPMEPAEPAPTPIPAPPAPTPESALRASMNAYVEQRRAA